MTNLEMLQQGAITTYKDAKAAYADKKITTGEIMKLLMDAMVGLQIDWSLIDDEAKALGVSGTHQLLVDAQTQLGDDALAKKIVAALGVIYNAVGFA